MEKWDINMIFTSNEFVIFRVQTTVLNFIKVCKFLHIDVPGELLQSHYHDGSIVNFVVTTPLLLLFVVVSENRWCTEACDGKPNNNHHSASTCDSSGR